MRLHPLPPHIAFAIRARDQQPAGATPIMDRYASHCRAAIAAESEAHPIVGWSGSSVSCGCGWVGALVDFPEHVSADPRERAMAAGVSLLLVDQVGALSAGQRRALFAVWAEEGA